MIENAGIDYKELYLQMQSAVVALSKTLEEIQKENKNLKEENEYLKRKLFGTKSETSKSLGFEQLSLFDEAEDQCMSGISGKIQCTCFCKCFQHLFIDLRISLYQVVK